MNNTQEVKKQYMGNKIKKAVSVLDKRREAMNDLMENITTNSLDELLLPLRHFNGAYILKDGKLIHGEMVEDSIYYYDPDGDYNQRRFWNEELKSDKITADYNSGRRVVCNHVLTGDSLYAVERNGEFVFEHNGIIVTEFSTKQEPILSDGGNSYIKKVMVQDGYSHGYRKSFPRYKAVYKRLVDGVYNDIGSLKSTLELVFSEDVVHSCSRSFDSYNYSVDGIKLGKKELVKELNNSQAMYFKDDTFYFIEEDGNRNYVAISITSKKYKGLKYCLVANRMFYYSDTNKGAVTVNSVYTTSIGELYVMFDEDFNLVFKNTPYHKFGTVLGNSIIKENKIYNLDFSDTVIKYGAVEESNYQLTTCPEGEIYLIDKIFVILRNGEIFLFHRSEKTSTENVLKEYKNLRFERRKSKFYMNELGKELLIYAGGDEAFKITEDEFFIKSLKLISENAAVISGKDNKLYCINNKGLKCTIAPLEEYEEFYGDDNIVGLKKDGSIEVNNFNLAFKDNEIRLGEKIVWSKVKYKGNLVFHSVEPVENCESYVSIDLKDSKYALVTMSGRSLYQDKYFDCYKNSVGIFAYLKKEDFEIAITEDEQNAIQSDSAFVSTIRGFFVNGYHIQSALLSTVQRYSEDIYNLVKTTIKKQKIDSKSAVETLINNSVMTAVCERAAKYEINLIPDNIENAPSIKDALLVLLNIDNIKRNCPIPFDILARDIESSLKNPDFNFTESEYFRSNNLFNQKKFIEYGFSIDKFNGFTGETSFKSTTVQNRLQKDTLSNSLYAQLFNLIGSRKRRIEGILQLSNLEYLNSVGEDISEDISSHIKSMPISDMQTVVKILNNCGYKIHGLIKKYVIDMDHTNLCVIINNQLPEKVAIRKFKQIAEDLLTVREKIVKEIEDSPIDRVVKAYAVKYIKWSLNHIEDDFAAVQTDVDFKEKTFIIKLWDRKNLITNLVQGNKTHCCIAANNYNIGALINYIYNRNMVLVEIRSKEDIVGQAFVYMAVSENKLLYRFENRYHIFMVIDNVEINNNYTPYAEDIARNLQKFMIDYAEYVGSNVSDVLLGTSYNDITPPYDFKADIYLAMIGFDHYRDSKKSFYKFI